MEFCKAYNALTQNQEGMIIPVVITVYADRSFTFVTKTPPTSVLLKQAAQVAKGAHDPKREKVGNVTAAQVKEIAELKYQDLNAINMDGAIRIVEGTARSMGIEVVK
jgi:large subunit ribosomal protein L11